MKMYKKSVTCKTEKLSYVVFGVSLLIALLVNPEKIQAQTGKNQYNFAQTYLGVQADGLIARKSADAFLNSPDFGASRILIGGRHFWGKADFYISFPIYNLSLSTSNSWQYSEGVITGGRIMPFKIGETIQPFFGVQWVNPEFTYKNGPAEFRDALGLEVGVSKIFARSWSIEAVAHYLANQDYNYFISRDEMVKAQLPNWGFSLCIKKHFDFTAGLASESAQEHVEQAEQTMREKGGLNSFSVAIGPSATVGLAPVSFAEDFPWINQKVETAIHPDVAIGYYFHRPDLGLRLSYRPVTLNQKGHDLEIRHRQQHLSLEAFKFLFDYHGFVPFVGVSGGATHYHLNAKDRETSIADKADWLPSYGLIFGWDIRPTNTEWLILRTNLRYLPALDFEHFRKQVSAPQLEVNFIQVVFYPERFIRHHQTSKP